MNKTHATMKNVLTFDGSSVVFIFNNVLRYFVVSHYSIVLRVAVAISLVDSSVGDDISATRKHLLTVA